MNSTRNGGRAQPKAPPRSLDEARAVDVAATAADEPVEARVPVGLCLMCERPGDGGRDPLGNEFCPSCWEQRAARLAGERPPRLGRRPAGDPRDPDALPPPDVVRAETARILSRFNRQLIPERTPYRDRD